MEHKAYGFDWRSFSNELLPILSKALEDNESDGLKEFIANNLHYLTDPYEGNPLTSGWEENLESRDVQEYGDYALTKYYDPTDDHGIERWIEISDTVEDKGKDSLLGIAIGSEERLFDPGRMGSYFMDQQLLKTSISQVESLKNSELAEFREFLIECSSKGLGVYVTF